MLIIETGRVVIVPLGNIKLLSQGLDIIVGSAFPFIVCIFKFNSCFCILVKMHF